MRNLRLVIAYDGTAYHGWQVQPGLPTVAGQLRRVLAPITQTDVRLIASSRTDAGVHARGQVANFHTDSPIAVDRLRRAANSRLPADIVVRRLDEAPAGFHATRDAMGKHYRYRLWADPEKPDPEVAGRVYHFHRPADWEAARRAARLLVGRHDFKSFETTGSNPRSSTVRTVHRIGLRVRGPEIWIEVAGDGFLYNMVRNMVGTLLEVARGHWPPERMTDVLAARDRTAAGPTAPAQGLTLMRVFYAQLGDVPVERTED